MAEWLTLLHQLDIPDGAVPGLSASDKPVLKGKLLQLAAADRPLFFVGSPLEVLKTLRTLLPDAPSGLQATMGLTGKQAAQLAELHEELLERRSVNISDVNSSEWKEVRASSQLEVQVWQKPMQPRSKPKTACEIPLFGWAGDLERTQADRYGPHIKSCISTTRDVQWVDAAINYPRLLETAKCGSLPFALKGTTDFAAVECASMRARMPITGLKMLFELKKAITSGTLYQAMVQLLVANLHTPAHQPVMVHTDLRDEWHILWMDGNKIWTHTPANRFAAVAMIEDILNNPDVENLGTSSNGALRNEIAGISPLLKRRRFLQPEGGSNPCMPLTDLAEMLPADEYKAALVESVLQQLCNLPAVAAMRLAPANMYS